MLKNYFKIAWRNIFRNKTFSVINISGLAIGMASAMFILLWVQNELSYDNFYKNNNRLYQAWCRTKGNNGINADNITPKILAPTLKQDYPEIEKATRVNWNTSILFTIGEKKLTVTGTMVDPDFLTMFSFPFLEGNMNAALNNPNDIVITQKLAKKLFGNEDAMGKSIRLENKYNCIVSGIMKDLPNNTQFGFEYLLPWSYLQATKQDDYNGDSSWTNFGTYIYVLLKPNTNLASVNAKIKNVIIKHSPAEVATELFLYPVSKLHLYSDFTNGQPSSGKINTVRVFVLIAVFILVIACINFMNMSTARSEKRAKEVGIRKVAGAQKKSLIGQFLGESILIAVFAGMLALIIVHIFLPAFNMLTSKQLAIDGDIYFWLYFTAFILFTGIVAGSYPAFFLSSFKPVYVLKGTFKKAHALVTPRKVLVVLQFTFAIIMIVGTIIIEQQIKYGQERETGYNKNNLIYIPFSGDINKNYALIKQNLINERIAASVTKTTSSLTEGYSFDVPTWAGKDPNDKTEFNYYSTDGNFVKTAGLQLVAGRDIDLTNYPTDSNAVVLNETAVRLMHFKNPIGQVIDRGSYGTDWHVIGVVKDFIQQSPYDPIKPMVIQSSKANWFSGIHIKFNAANTTAQNLAATEKVFKKYNTEYPFEYNFIDEEYARKFNDEQTTGTLIALFAGLTIFISCLGLFGLVTYIAENRIKEIGVRKVLGASVSSIATLLSKDFIKLVIIAIVIASPVAWWAMNKWLQSFTYRVIISWWVFALAGLLAIIIAIATISLKAIKAAIANPVKSLRTE